MSTLALYVANDNVLELNGLIDELAGTYINSATVTYALKDSDGATVDSGSMTYVSASNGVYRATLADTLSITAGESYTAVIDADGGPGLKYHSESAVIAKTRT